MTAGPITAPAYYQGSGKGVIDQICKSHEGLLSHSHQVTNILITLDGNRAGSEAYMSGTMPTMRTGKVMQIGVWAGYLDSWERRDGRWGIVRRTTVFDHQEIREVTPFEQHSGATRDRDDLSYRILSRERR